MRPDRSIFAGKRYLPVGLVEAGRGCHFRCEFCAIQSYFGNTQTRRPTDEILEEVRRVKKPLIFFVDDNITSNMDQAKEFFRALIPLKVRWVSQASINAAHDEEFLQLIKASGCQGLLIGFETLNEENLRRMRKGFNLMNGGYENGPGEPAPPRHPPVRDVHPRVRRGHVSTRLRRRWRSPSATASTSSRSIT